MPRIGVKLREACRSYGVDNAKKLLREGIAQGKIRRSDVHLKELAQAFMGENADRAYEEYRRGGWQLRESASAVDASNFAAITGQLLVDTIREKYELATKVGDQIFDTKPISNGNLTTQREPWLSRVQHDPKVVQQGMPYPTTSFIGQYVDYPAPEKLGEICLVTMEMIFSDLTGQAYESAESVGEITGLAVEYRKLAVFLGLIKNHSWNGTGYNTYLTTGAWINKMTDFTLTDWRSVNRFEQLFAQMTDPVTGKPIEVNVKDMFVMPAAKYTQARILNAVEVREGDITTGNGTQTVSSNPLETNYNRLTSKHARYIAVNGVTDLVSGGYTAAKADTITIAGDFKKAFVWREAKKLEVVQAPPQNMWEFAQDIAIAVKASVWGAACVRDPRFVGLGFNDSAS